MIVQELHKIQQHYGYLPEEQLRRLAERLNIKLHRLHEVASFFPHFHLHPPATVEVQVCGVMACHLADSEQVCRHLKNVAEELGENQVNVRTTSCLGRCDGAPVVTINDHVYWNKSPKDLEELVRAAAARQTLPEQRTSTPRGAPCTHGPWRIDPYQGQPRYDAVRRFVEAWKADHEPEAAKKRMSAGDPLLRMLEEAGLRGMGGAGFPTFKKWSAVRGAPGKEKYVVCNGDESEPGTFKDRDLLVFAPHLVIEGVILAGLASGATKGYIYIRHEYQEQIESVAAEIRRAEDKGFCGSNILGSDLTFPVEVFVSPGGYICGEESALLEAMEDRRAEPRNKPPITAFEGLYGKPTIINNVETLSWVPSILLAGGGWYRELGAHQARGMRFVSVSGHVARPGVYEVPLGQTVRELIFVTAGGMSRAPGAPGRRSLKAIATSGPSGGFLPAELDLTKAPPRFVQALRDRKVVAPGATQLDILDLPLDFDVLQPFPDFMLGAAFIVYGSDADMLEAALNCATFFRNESCGKCVPCRIGTQKMVEMIGALLAGEGHDDLSTLDELAQAMLLSSICGLGQVASNPLLSVLRYFREDLHKHQKA